MTNSSHLTFAFTVYFENTFDVQHNLEDLFVHPQTSLTLTWSPESIVPMMDPDTYVVDILLAQFDPSEGQWRDVQMLAEGVENTGRRQVDIPLVFTAEDGLLIDIRPISFQVRLGQAHPLTNSRRKRIIETLRGVVRQWSTDIYYGISDILRTQCEQWCATQPEDIGELILDELPPCPPELGQASLPNSGLVEDSGVGRSLSNRFFHRGTDTCFRTREPRSVYMY